MARFCADAGQRVKTNFTISAAPRYARTMFLVFAAAVASSASATHTGVRSVATGQAVVRILESVRLRVGSDRAESGQPVRSMLIRGEDGSRVPARLVEFE